MKSRPLSATGALKIVLRQRASKVGRRPMNRRRLACEVVDVSQPNQERGE